MLGAYHPEYAVLRRSEDGGIDTLFRDTIHRYDGGDFIREREMVIEGRCFRISSVFPEESNATPTDKLISYIDTELAKENRSA